MTDDGHAGDRLSALLDAQLDASEVADVTSHVEVCPPCHAELERVRAARQWVRDLPAVDPPFGMYERLLLRRRRGRAVAAWAATAAAAVLVVNLATSRPEPVAPELPQLVGVHAATASVSGEPVSQLAPAAVPVTFVELDRPR
jgi:anti-sigma factor RsiW